MADLSAFLGSICKKCLYLLINKGRLNILGGVYFDRKTLKNGFLYAYCVSVRGRGRRQGGCEIRSGTLLTYRKVSVSVLVFQFHTKLTWLRVAHEAV